MKTILLLAAIHILIVHQSRKKIQPGKVISPAKATVQTQTQKSYGGFIFSNMKLAEKKAPIHITGKSLDGRTSRKEFPINY